MSPGDSKFGKIADEPRSHKRPMDDMDSPWSLRFHISAFCISVESIRCRLIMRTFRYAVEFAVTKGQINLYA